MMTRAMLLAVLLTAGWAFGADINGKWTASFETQIGTQNYTYTFQADGEKLTGTAKSDNAESKITEGKISGDTVSFVEMQNYQGQELRIVYKGKITGDEIKFTRNVADFVNEELTAKRVK
jgi:hypothetical protein